MGRILPFYRTGGALSGGGGGGGNTGVPLGPFANWAALPVSAQGGAFAVVLDLGPASSSGLATYDAGAGQWQLSFGTFLTLADLLSFAEPISGNALATVGASLDDPTSVRYQWDGSQWLRTPDPVEYIYSASTWGTLPTQDTIQPMDEVTVNDLGYTHSSGRGQRHGNEWRLIEGKFQSVADMTAFDGLYPVETDAIALVKAGGGHDEEAIAYSYQGGAFVRFGATVTAGYTWPLTFLEAISGFRPVGSQDGDFGIISASGGPVILRLKVGCTLGYGGTRDAWITPLAYAGSPILQAWTVGTEPNTGTGGLTTQGWTISNDAGCTVIATGGYQRIASPATATGARLQAIVGTVTSGLKVECLFEARTSSSASNNLTIAPFIGDGTNTTCMRQCSALGYGFGAVVFNTGPNMTPARNNTYDNLPALNATAAIILVRDEGRTVFSSADRNGLRIGDYRRNLTTDLGNFVQFSANGSTSGANSLDFRGQVVTY